MVVGCWLLIVAVVVRLVQFEQSMFEQSRFRAIEVGAFDDGAVEVRAIMLGAVEVRAIKLGAVEQ